MDVVDGLLLPKWIYSSLCTLPTCKFITIRKLMAFSTQEHELLIANEDLRQKVFSCGVDRFLKLYFWGLSWQNTYRSGLSLCGLLASSIRSNLYINWNGLGFLVYCCSLQMLKGLLTQLQLERTCLKALGPWRALSHETSLWAHSSRKSLCILTPTFETHKGHRRLYNWGTHFQTPIRASLHVSLYHIVTVELMSWSTIKWYLLW